MTITLTPRETARLIVDRANELQELVNQKCDELDDAVSEVTAAIYLDKMTKDRELSVRAAPVRDQKDATSLPKTASEVEAETERLVRNAQEYQQTARRVLKEVR